MTQRLTLFAIAILLALFAPAASADHSQTLPSGQTLTFDHRGGNEWWVEVALGGTEGAWIVMVEARDTGGAWVHLEKKPWGVWAGSFHIEPGHEVSFRATTRGNVAMESCAFSHPGGTERCGSSAPPASGFDATFTNARGNEWWVETDVRATGGTVAKVEASVNGGAWQPLSQTSWGSWAKGIHAPTDSTVRFRAVSSEGATDVSDPYRWPPR